MHRNDFSIRIRNLGISLAIFVALALYVSTFAEPVLRVSLMPDESPSVQRRKLKPLTDYLEKKIGTKIEYRPMPDGDTLVEALVSNKLDIVFLDGFHFVQARMRSHDQVIPLVQRAEDATTQSVFITAHDDIARLEDLRGRTIAFGAETSASGHLMPRIYLQAAHIDPDADMKRIFSGKPEATVAAVASGKADVGALSSEAWENLVGQGKVDAKVLHVFYTTPGYSDYTWTVRADMDIKLRQKLTDAFLALDHDNGLDNEILALQDASRFVPARGANYSAIEMAVKSAGLLK